MNSDAKKRRRHLRSGWEIPDSKNLATSVSKSAPKPRLSASVAVDRAFENLQSACQFQGMAGNSRKRNKKIGNFGCDYLLCICRM
ncbi:hypothetical protein IE4771_PD00513 (plasmid) [Rhizobium etli bv. mimosae str. IE4771]|uniref:Uncharacterized protein n=1 Tax=Rhizobium etli bv. mimosae str. IE4771 TaxID=1432050 RepID=A0A060IBF6_RHIET|nr:hypothetical protein IE4771_PD00513 [Rhizobium sp. IE4771]